MKRLIPLLLLLTAAFAQTTLNVDQPFLVDSNGFVELRAVAGVQEGKDLVCYKTNVSVFINDYEYDLKKFVDCNPFLYFLEHRLKQLQ